MEHDQLIRAYPRVYHMAEGGTWPSIRSNGLLSTKAVLDKFDLQGGARKRLEESHRPEKITVGGAASSIVLRDQKPMFPKRLEMALQGRITPAEWYKTINSYVFFWAEESRLMGLLNARAYRHLEHDVLTVDTASLVAAHSESMRLCPMNSGNTFPVPHKRDFGIFIPIQGYPVGIRSGKPVKPVVEVLVEYSVPNVAEHVIQVRRMRGATVLETAYTR